MKYKTNKTWDDPQTIQRGTPRRLAPWPWEGNTGLPFEARPIVSTATFASQP